MFLLYHDEDTLEGGLVSALRRAGFDCLTVTEAGMRGQSDEEQLAFATVNHRVIFTKNTRDFRRLDSEWWSTGLSHAGIIVLNRRRIDIGRQLRAFQTMAERFSAEDMAGRVEFLLNYE